MSLTPASLFALTTAMLMLAALPSISVLAVTSRTRAGGFCHGAAVSAGVVVGDLIFVLIALFGLQVLLAATGVWALSLKYLAAAYLLWMALTIWRSRQPVFEGHPAQTSTPATAPLSTSFVSGLLLTLGDQKAVLFYLGFFPAFLDLTAITGLDILLIMVVTVLSVGGVKLGYVWLVSRAGLALWRSDQTQRLTRLLNRLASAMLVLAAAMVLLRY